MDVEGETKYVFTADGMYEGKSIVIATGSKGRNRMLPGEENLLGRGVSTCATCDGAFFEGKTVAVIGDSEEALEEAQALSKFAESHLLRRTTARAARCAPCSRIDEGTRYSLQSQAA